MSEKKEDDGRFSTDYWTLKRYLDNHLHDVGNRVNLTTGKKCSICRIKFERLDLPIPGIQIAYPVSFFVGVTVKKQDDEGAFTVLDDLLCLLSDELIELSQYCWNFVCA